MSTVDNSLGESEVRRAIERWGVALRAKDAAAMSAGYSPDVVVFDLVPPLRSIGTDAYREKLEAWLASFRGPVGFEMRELDIAVGDDVAFSRSLNHVTGTRSSGETIDVWVRVTLGFRKLGGRWWVVHEHDSVPLDMQTGKASLDLEP
jgi:uncharacterized protein (TIGR02246 family)